MPGNCSQCERLGETCIDKANLTQRCEGLGWSAETACEERKPCRKLFPSACVVCEALGVYCIEENNVMEQCIELGLSRGHLFRELLPIYSKFYSLIWFIQHGEKKCSLDNPAWLKWDGHKTMDVTKWKMSSKTRVHICSMDACQWCGYSMLLVAHFSWLTSNPLCSVKYNCRTVH